MATVYLAEDVRHHRRVAVKVLRPELAASLGADRFLREIETAAQFQHPHILPLLDSGEAAGFLYYVMPYVEGESLRSRLGRRGELPVHDAVRLLIEICDALAYAHERGIVHRDIKPDNVLLSGRHALVTDFGVAKALSEATGRHQLTTAGIALGTPTYMAPEQATADPNIDHRADVYALGVVGFELVAGKPPFSGRTPQETLAAHVTHRPEPLCTLRPACPAALEAVIMKCLEKRPADRWQTAEELLSQLEPLATPSGGTTPSTTRPLAPVTPVPLSWRRWLPAAAGLLALATALALAIHRSPSELRFGRRLQLTLSPGMEIDPALSPEGDLVAFVIGPAQQTRLYVRQVDGGAPVAITAEGGFARVPRYSPDGKRLVYRSARGIEVIPALGGASRLVVSAQASDWLDAAWSPDGKSLVYGSRDSVLARAVESGPARLIAHLTEAHSCAWSTDGERVACVSGNRTFVTRTRFGNIAASSVWVIPAAGGSPVPVTDDRTLNTSPAWLPDGSLLYVSNRDGGRDLYRVELARDGRPARAALRVTTGLNAAQVSVSADGRRLAYAAFTETSNVWSVPIPSPGTRNVSEVVPVTSGTQIIEDFALSPDGKWLAFDSDRGGIQQIYRMPLTGGEPQQLTTGSEPAFQPDFSPDGREISYHAFYQGTRQVFVIPAEGGAPSQVTGGTGSVRYARWSPDGRMLSFVTGELGTPFTATHVATRDANGRWAPARLLEKGSSWGLWSPDGSAILFGRLLGGGRRELLIRWTSDERKRLVLPVPDTSSELLGSNGAWSEDGRLVYVLLAKGESGDIWSVPATGGRPRLILHLAKPPSRTFGFRVHGGKFYLVLGDQQSDIWMAEVEGSR
jgi:serine/threonine-protein kinase